MTTTSSIDKPTDLNRFEVENFKNTNAKRVPFEDLDYSIYKNANLVAFSTSEKRLPKWINFMKQRYYHGLEDNNMVQSRYEELDNPNEKSKFEKVLISLISKEASENILTITIMITTGRIQVQGRFMKEWGNNEFDPLVELVNSPDSVKLDATKDINNSLDTITQKRSNTTTTPSTTKDQLPADQTSSPKSPKEKSLSTVKTNLASLEAEFVEFSQNTNRAIHELTTLLTNKDEEIQQLKYEINTLNITKTQNQKLLSDLTIKQFESEEQIKKLHNRCKSLEDKNTHLVCQIAAPREILKPTEHPGTSDKTIITPPTTKTPHPNDNPTTATTITTTETTYKIPTANRFEHLTNESIPSPKNLPTNEQSKENTPNPNEESITNNIETIIICDSNGRHLNPNLLCPDTIRVNILDAQPLLKLNQ